MCNRRFLKCILPSLTLVVALTSLAQEVKAQAQLPQAPSPALSFRLNAGGPANASSIQSALLTMILNPSLRGPLTRLYADAGYQPLFVSGSSLTPLAIELRQSLAKIRENGLPLGDYWSQAHEALFAQPSSITDGLAAEFLLAETYVAACVHINVGRITAAQASPINKISPRSFVSFDLVKVGALGGGIGSTWDSLAPKAAGYQKLKTALAQLQGDISSKTHLSMAGQILAVQLNMEKYRWLPNDPGTRYLTVNTAMQTLRLTDPENTNPKLSEMRTINGKPDRPTPSMADHIESLELNPPWHVTKNIFAREKYPEILAVALQAAATHNPMLIQNWFESRNFILLDGLTSKPVDPTTIDWIHYVPLSSGVVLTERPGYTSSLGVVKFNLKTPPGPYYLHDTDTRAAFGDSFRMLSHGCIRVQNPIDLAEYLLAGSDWDRTRIEASVLKAGQVVDGNVSIPLPIPKPNHIPVYVLSLTADVGLDGVLYFAKDLYRDTTNLEQALRASGYYQQTTNSQVVARTPIGSRGL